jgi:hypothetical protein
MRPTKKQAQTLLELNRGNTIISTKDTLGRRFTRWKNFRGKSRAGKPNVSTFRAFKKRGWIEEEDVNTWRISEKGTEIAATIDLDNPYYTRIKRKVTANDILDALESYYAQIGLVLIREVSIAYQGERRADALVLGRGNETVIIDEVKVSRQDFLHELADDEKRQRALDLSSQYNFAAPQGMIQKDELPPEAGLLEMDKAGKIHPTVPAPHRRPEPPTWALVSAVARALKR